MSISPIKPKSIQSKSTIRTMVRSQLSLLTQSEYDQNSLSISKHVTDFISSLDSPINHVALFAPISKFREVDTFPLTVTLLSNDIICSFPRVISTDPGVMEFHSISSLDDLKICSDARFPVPEPLESNPSLASLPPIDLAFIPGVAFDKKGNRMGHGFGFYDVWIREMTKGNKFSRSDDGDSPNIPIPTKTRFTTPLFIGLAHNVQILPEIPTEDHDQPLDGIITPQQIIWRNEQIHLEESKS